MTRRPLALAAALGTLIPLVLPAAGARGKEEVWRHETAATLGVGRREGVVLSDAGRLELAPPLETLGKPDATRVWDLARTDDGALWAATGDQGRIYRRGPGADAAWTVAHDVEDTQVLCLAARGERIAAGTGGGGLIVELDAEGKVKASGRPDPAVSYVWDLEYAADGALLAATGPKGQLWRKPRDGAWALLFDAPQTHLLSLATGADGAVFIGTDAGALVYRVAADGTARVVLDAPQDEVRVLRLAGDGSLLAGTASELAGGSGSSRATTRRDGAGWRTVRLAAAQGTARLKAGAAGENVVYRIEPDGPARELFRLKGLVLALAESRGRILVGTGPEGRLFELRDGGREAVPLARLDHGQVLALLPDVRGGAVTVGAGDPAGVYRLEAGHVAEGTLTSEVLDAKLPARFGALTARAETPPGTRVAVELRTGRIGEPDATWSAWTPAGDSVPAGRFAQYRVRLATTDPAVSPVVTGVTLAYRTLNLAPEVSAITVPDVSAGDGATRRTKLDLKWEAVDPNEDPLVYTLAIRKDEWPDWIAIPTLAPLTEKSFSWDTTTVPTGRYQLRVKASDARGNPPAEALRGERVSDPFVVDHLPPVLGIDADRRPVRVALEDGLTRIVAAEFSVDGGDWTPAFAVDGLFDTAREALEIPLPELPPGPHVLVVRATDAAGNVGSADTVLTIPPEKP